MSTNILRMTMNMENIKKYLNSSRYKNYTTWNEKMGQYYIEYKNGNIVEKLWIEDEKALERVSIFAKEAFFLT